MFSSTAAVLLDWEEPWRRWLPGRALARRARTASGLRCARPGAAGGRGLHAGPQGHLYRAEDGADEPVVQLGFIAINGRPYMAWKRQASLIGERLLFLIA